MSSLRYNSGMSRPATFFQEISEQPGALARLAAYYHAGEGRDRLADLPAPGQPLLLGMGASYHSALAGAYLLQRRGIPALAMEAADALHGSSALLRRCAEVIYISQSGASAEIGPLVDQLPARAHLTAITNEPESPLAQRAQSVLPLLAGNEQTVATKTYANSLAVLWLLCRRWSERLDDEAFAALRAAAERQASLLAEASTIAERWQAALGKPQSFVFIGPGLHAITARQAAMMMMEWLKAPALDASVGAFRHGPIEIAQPGMGAVLFAHPSPGNDSAYRLAEELRAYGAKVLLVEGGHSRQPDEPALDSHRLDETLAPIVDVVPVQVFVEAAARERGLTPGFRYISKIVTSL